MTTKRTLPLLIAVCLLASGCVTVGNQRLADESVVSQVHVGQDQGEVRALLGAPNRVSTQDTGESTWDYMMISVTPNAAAFIPIVGLFAGRTDSTGSGLNLVFDKEKKVTKISRSSSTSQMRY